MSSYIAKKAANKKAEGLLAPLLESDDEDSSVDSEDSNASSKVETVKKSPLEKLKTLIVYGALGCGVVASAGAIVLAPAIAIYVMGGLCIANVPYSAFKEYKMGKIPSLRAMNNRLREDANNLEEQVDILSEEVDALEPEADRAAKVEEELRGIAETQSVNVNKLVELVKENGEILAKMRDNLRQRIVQDIIAIVVKSDRDNDNSIDKTEARTLALRIQLSLQEHKVTFDVEKFLKAIGDEPTVEKVIDLVQKLLPASKERKDDDDDSDYDSDDSEELDDMYDMFYMAEDDPRASGVGAGGVSLMNDAKKKKTKKLASVVRRQSVRKKSIERRKVRTKENDSDYSSGEDDY